MTDMRTFLNQLMADRELTLAALAAQLGYSSKTSLVRVMDGSARISSLYHLRDRLHTRIQLSQAEETALQQAVMSYLYGEETVAVWQEIWHLLQRTQRPTDGPVRLIHADGMAPDEDFDARYSQVTDLRIELMGCTGNAIFVRLAHLLEREDVRVRHYISMPQVTADSVRSGNVVGYLMRYRGYEVVTPETPALDTVLVSAVYGRIMVCEYLRNGVPCEDLIISNTAGTGTLITRENSRNCFRRLTGLDQVRSRPIKKMFSREQEAEELLAYAAEYGELEHDTALFMLKPDISTNYIPVKFLSAACEKEMPPELKSPMMTIYQERYENAVSKRRQTVIVLKQNAMRRFALTGRTMDHFYLMRPFTPQERVEILTALLGLMENNAYFHLVYLKTDDAVADMDITLYRGKCMILLPPDNDFHLMNAAPVEIRVRNPQLIKTYELFFQEELVRASCLTERESCAFMRQLIRLAKEAEA